MSAQEFMEAEPCMSRSTGTCMVMGTASTMAIIVEASGCRCRTTRRSRRSMRAVTPWRTSPAGGSSVMVREDIPLSRMLTREAFENAIRVNGAVGGSTNAVIHLLAMAGRIGVPLTLDDWDDLGRDRADDRRPDAVGPVHDGGLLLRRRLAGRSCGRWVRRTCSTAMRSPSTAGRCGKTRRRRRITIAEVIRPLDRPVVAHGGIAVLCGNLAPAGAVLKPSAASPRLMTHRGRAVVFENIEHYKTRIDDPDLDVDAEFGAGAQELRTQGLPGHGRGREHGPSTEAPAARA